jgi:hypothetical protein
MLLLVEPPGTVCAVCANFVPMQPDSLHLLFEAANPHIQSLLLTHEHQDQWEFTLEAEQVRSNFRSECFITCGSFPFRICGNSVPTRAGIGKVFHWWEGTVQQTLRTL